MKSYRKVRGIRKYCCFFSIFLVMIFVGGEGLHAQINTTIADKVFKFDFGDSKQYRIHVYNAQKIYIDGVLEHSNITIENKILVNILEKGVNGFLIDYTIETIENNKLISEEYSVFHQNINGNIVVPKRFDAPFIRNIPSFPRASIKKGESWTAVGIENFIDQKSGNHALVEISVKYTYKGVKKIPQAMYDRVSDLSIIRLSEAPYIIAEYEIKDRRLQSRDVNQDAVLHAKFRIGLWWNEAFGRIESYNENFEINIQYPDRVEQFVGSAEAVMIPVKKLYAKVDEIQEILSSVIDDVVVTKNEKGISIVVDKIQFLPNSAILTSDEVKKLAYIAEVLKLYKGRRILVEGHTALAGTEAQRMVLSTERAKEVVAILNAYIPQNNIDFNYRGLGATVPIAPNTLDAGREKNRRVEITILEN